MFKLETDSIIADSNSIARAVTFQLLYIWNFAQRIHLLQPGDNFEYFIAERLVANRLKIALKLLQNSTFMTGRVAS